ncbi:MAG: hypothetical protein K6G50_11195 [bacterium]|nr:hypothetical protein [bacterium]
MIRSMSRGARCVLSIAAVLLLASALYGVANASGLYDVIITKASGQWVKIGVKAYGPVNCKVRELAPDVYNYRQVVMDVWPATFSGVEPKELIPVNDGLVAQVRLEQLTDDVVRIYADVIYWPKYEVVYENGMPQLVLYSFNQRGTKN